MRAHTEQHDFASLLPLPVPSYSRRYISSGSGKGNAVGLAAVSAVVFPIFYFIRLYRPGPPMTNIVFLFTSQFVVGFSWQDEHIFTLASPGECL